MIVQANANVATIMGITTTSMIRRRIDFPQQEVKVRAMSSEQRTALH
jgi:hypothetical protein